MRHIIFVIGILTGILVFTRCEKETSDNGTISLIKTLPGGCNNQKSAQLTNLYGEQPDTVLLSARKDTLDIFVGLNYICCAPFKTTSAVRNDSIVIRITDTCLYPSQNCYCKCMCYYTWDFIFAGYQQQKYGYKIILMDPRQKDPILIKEGRINL